MRNCQYSNPNKAAAQIFAQVIGGRRLAVFLNLTGRSARIDAPPGRLLLATDLRPPGEALDGAMTIDPNGGLVAELI